MRTRALCLCVSLCLWGVGVGEAVTVTVTRHKRVVGGEAASPPPPGASEAEDVVENPALSAVQGVKPPPSTSTTPRPRPPVTDDDLGGTIVFLRRGRREARVRGSQEDGIYAFRGIRYAEPPVGARRFQRPRRKKMEGDVEARSSGPPCPQTVGKQLIGNEDCLCLNIFSPELPKDSNAKKYPVVLWIHGGGFRRGSGSQYGVTDLVKKGLVVVTIQYRLGSLGFLSNNKKELPGNAGLFDIAASLRWVRDYVQFFGGDRDHIVPSGQGSGASAAIMLTLAHFTKSWMKGVFAMSGSAISSFAVDEKPAKTAEQVSAIDACQSSGNSLEFVRCMQKLPLETVIKGDDKLQEEKLTNDNSAQSYITSISKLLNPGPAVEGEDDMRFLPHFLSATPAELLQKGNFAQVPLLTGVTKHETSTSAKGGGLATKLLGQVEATEELLQSLIPQLLKVNTGIFGNNSLSPLVDQLFSNNAYLKGITSSLSGVASSLDKIIEVTTDALFNLPAFLTSNLWSKQNKAYLYSFEHESQTSAADDFLQENPLTEQTQKDAHVEGVGHGDDLQYLFDVRSVEGEKVEVPGLKTAEDKKVREHFTELVAEFVRSGVPKVAGQSVKPFTQQGGDYLIIKPAPALASGFRKCQMGLWAGLTEVLKSAECSFLQLGDLLRLDGLKGATDTLTKPTANVANNLKNTTGSLTGGLTGLLGGNKGSGSTQKPLLGLG